MCNRNGKYECIPIKLSMLVFECISVKRTATFHEKILFDSGVINVQTPMTKYFGFQYSTNSVNKEMVFSADYHVLIKLSKLNYH